MALTGVERLSSRAWAVAPIMTILSLNVAGVQDGRFPGFLPHLGLDQFGYAVAPEVPGLIEIEVQPAVRGEGYLRQGQARVGEQGQGQRQDGYPAAGGRRNAAGGGRCGLGQAPPGRCRAPRKASRIEGRGSQHFPSLDGRRESTGGAARANLARSAPRPSWS